MTNREKLKEIFPRTIFIYRKEDDKTVAIQCSDEWLNAEYREPTTKNDLGVDCIKKSDAINIIQDMHGLARADVISDAVNRIITMPSVTPQLSSELEKNSKKLEKGTTKNDLGVDCIDRSELLKAMDTWDKFGYSARYGLERLDKDDKGFVPYVKYEDMVNCVKGMPSVTPQEPQSFKWCETCKEYDQEKHCCHRWSKVIRDTVEEMKQEPKTGHWNSIPKYPDIAWCCSECKHFTTMKHNYCPNCGARMESE